MALSENNSMSRAMAPYENGLSLSGSDKGESVGMARLEEENLRLKKALTKAEQRCKRAEQRCKKAEAKVKEYVDAMDEQQERISALEKELATQEEDGDTQAEPERDELVEFIKEKTYDPHVNTRFEGYVHMKPKACGDFGELYVTEKMTEEGHEVLPRLDPGHDRIIDGKKTEIKFGLASRRGERERKRGMSPTIRNNFVINHVGRQKDWERLIFVCINEAEDKDEDDHLIRWFTKEDFCRTLKKFFNRQQGGKKGGNDDWMCSGSDLGRLLEHELVKKIDEW